MSDTMVRMGELATSKTLGDMLVTLGLGCKPSEGPQVAFLL